MPFSPIKFHDRADAGKKLSKKLRLYEAFLERLALHL